MKIYNKIFLVLILAGASLIIFIVLRPKDEYQKILKRQRESQAEAILKILYQCRFDYGGWQEEITAMEEDKYYLLGGGFECQRVGIFGTIDFKNLNCGGGRKIVPDYISDDKQILGSGGFYFRKTAGGKTAVGSCADEIEVVQ